MGQLLRPGRRHHALRRPYEELILQHPPQPVQSMAHRRLAQAQPLPRLGDAALTQDRFEDDKKIEVKGRQLHAIFRSCRRGDIHWTNYIVTKMHLQHERLRPILVARLKVESGRMGGLLLHELRSSDGVEARPRALVVILFAANGAEQALARARQWQPSVPQAAFVGIELDAAVERTDIAALQRTAAAAAPARSLPMSQVILLGAGAAGRVAVNLVLRGITPAMGVIGIDIAPTPAPTRIMPTAARIRLVQRRTSEDAQAAGFRALVEAMRRQDIDVRSMVLPEAANDAAGVTLRASGSFLVELVANASRLPLAARRRP